MNLVENENVKVRGYQFALICIISVLMLYVGDLFPRNRDPLDLYFFKLKLIREGSQWNIALWVVLQKVVIILLMLNFFIFNINKQIVYFLSPIIGVFVFQFIERFSFYFILENRINDYYIFPVIIIVSFLLIKIKLINNKKRKQQEQYQFVLNMKLYNLKEKTISLERNNYLISSLLKNIKSDKNIYSHFNIISELISGILKSSQHKFIDLENELKLFRLYLKYLKIENEFIDDVKFDFIDVDMLSEEVQLSPLTLQLVFDKYFVNSLDVAVKNLHITLILSTHNILMEIKFKIEGQKQGLIKNILVDEFDKKLIKIICEKQESRYYTLKFELNI